jgi:hypothetical protein
VLKIILPLIMCLFLIQCGGLSNHYDIKIDPSFDDQQKENIANALYNWQQAVPELSLSIYIEQCPIKIGTDQICIINSSREYIDSREHDDSLALTTRNYTDQNSMVYIPTDDEWSAYPPGQVQIITHELGHAFGLHHTGAGTLMCAQAWYEPPPLASPGCAAEFITCQDIAQYKEVRGEEQPRCE